jgi:hypothetical protein
MSHSDPSYTPTRTFQSDSVEVPNQFGMLFNMVQQVSVLSQKSYGSPDRSPKLVVPAPYDGSAEDFDVFCGDIHDYLKVKSDSFRTDFAKITFVSGLLTGSAKIWFQAVRERSHYFEVPELKDFISFSNSFKEHFMNRESRSQAKAKLDKLNREALRCMWNLWLYKQD